MIIEQNHILDAILQELKAMRAELQCLRGGLNGAASHGTGLVKPANGNGNGRAVLLEPEGGNGGKGTLAVSDWLKRKGITVKNYRQQSAADGVFDRLALFLGDRYQNLARLHELIRRNLQKGSGFTMNLSSKDPAEIADLTQFCKMLSDYAFVSAYHYNKKTRMIYAAPQREGKVTNFFNGDWFERYAYLKIEALLLQHKAAFTFLPNPQVTLQTNGDSELDLLFVVEEQPLWVECKTGGYAAYITRYSEVRKALSVPKHRAFLLVLGITDELTDELTNFYDVTVANERNFLEKIRMGLGLPAPALAQAAHETEPPALNGSTPARPAPALPAKTSPAPNGALNISSLLNKNGLRPLPELRQQILEALLATAGALDKPVTMVEMKALLAEQVPASKSQLQHVMNVMVRSGCLLDKQGLSVTSFTKPFLRLISDSSAVIESKCMESYARAVLMADATFFDSAANVAEFEQLTGGKAPDTATITRLRQAFRPGAAALLPLSGADDPGT